MCALVSRIFSRHAFEQVIVRFRRVSAEEHVAVIVHGGDLHAGLAQKESEYPRAAPHKGSKTTRSPAF